MKTGQVFLSKNFAQYKYYTIEAENRVEDKIAYSLNDSWIIMNRIG